MGRKRRGKLNKNCFVLPLPLKCQPWQRDKLNRVFFCTNRVKNLLISNRPKALHQMERTREWKYVQRHIQELYSKRYQRMELLLRSLFRQERELRKQHHELANRLLKTGNPFYIEEMNFQALAKKAKEAKKNDKGKYRSRKRYGKSIARNAPALFVAFASLVFT